MGIAKQCVRTDLMTAFSVSMPANYTSVQIYTYTQNNSLWNAMTVYLENDTPLECTKLYGKML